MNRGFQFTVPANTSFAIIVFAVNGTAGLGPVRASHCTRLTSRMVLLAGLVVQYFHDWPGKIGRLTTVRHRVLRDEPLAMLGWKDY